MACRVLRLDASNGGSPPSHRSAPTIRSTAFISNPAISPVASDTAERLVMSINPSVTPRSPPPARHRAVTRRQGICLDAVPPASLLAEKRGVAAAVGLRASRGFGATASIRARAQARRDSRKGPRPDRARTTRRSRRRRRRRRREFGTRSSSRGRGRRQGHANRPRRDASRLLASARRGVSASATRPHSRAVVEGPRHVECMCSSCTRPRRPPRDRDCSRSAAPAGPQETPSPAVKPKFRARSPSTHFIWRRCRYRVPAPSVPATDRGEIFFLEMNTASMSAPRPRVTGSPWSIRSSRCRGPPARARQQRRCASCEAATAVDVRSTPGR